MASMYRDLNLFGVFQRRLKELNADDTAATALLTGFLLDPEHNVQTVKDHIKELEKQK